jgi:hypothetical protein
MRSKIRIVVIILVFLLAGLWFLLRIPHKTTGTIQSSPELVSKPPTASNTALTGAPKSNAGTAGTNTALAEETQKYLAEVARDPLIEWKFPINFWGKVIDERDQPVEGAKIRFVWNDLSKNGTAEKKTVSDVNGAFALVAEKGKRLYVWVEKEGFYNYADSARKDFEYADPFERFHPDPTNPVIFRLKKAGKLEPMTAHAVALPIPNDGTPTEFDLLSERWIEPGSIQFRCEVGPADPQTRHHDWRLRISVPTGGLLERTNSVDFDAPKDGYAGEIERLVLRDDLHWQRGFESSFFIKFGNPARFGRIIVEFSAQRKEYLPNSSIIMKYWVNTSGSRNLEADPAQMPQRIPQAYLKSGLPRQN